MNETAQDHRPWYRQFWPWFLITPPLLAVIGGIITIRIAFEHETGLVTEQYYQEGISINRQIEKQQMAARLNTRAQIEFLKEPSELVLTLSTDAPAPQVLYLELKSPLDHTQDLEFELHPIGDQQYQTQVHSAPKGRYYASLRPKEDTWLVKSELDISAQHPGLLAAGTGRTTP